jgi:hypothetical protein
VLAGRFARLGRHYGRHGVSAAERLGPLAGGDLPGLAPVPAAPAPGCSLALAVPGLCAQVRAGRRDDVDLGALLDDFEAAGAEVHAGISAHSGSAVRPGGRGADALALAGRYEFVLAGAAGLLVLANRPQEAGVRVLVRAGLELALGRLTPARIGRSEPFAALAGHLLDGGATLALISEPFRRGPVRDGDHPLTASA